MYVIIDNGKKVLYGIVNTGRKVGLSLQNAPYRSLIKTGLVLTGYPDSLIARDMCVYCCCCLLDGALMTELIGLLSPQHITPIVHHLTTRCTHILKPCTFVCIN